jgi:flagellar assembly protein FliH
MQLSNDASGMTPDQVQTIDWRPGDFNHLSSTMANQPGSEGAKQENLTQNSFTPLSAIDWPTADLEISDLPHASKPPESDYPPSEPKIPNLWIPEDIDTYYDGDNKEGGSPVGQGHKKRSNTSGVVLKFKNQASDILTQAETRAKDMLNEAESQVAEITRQAYTEGIASANAETDTLLQTAREIVEEVQAWKEATLNQGEVMMLRLIIEIAQTIFGDGLPLDPKMLGQTFSRALSQAKTLGDLRIYVHPEDAIAISPHWNRMQAAFGGQRIELIPSEIIKRGGCFIDGQFGSVDARVETQIEIAKDSLFSTLAKSNGRER